MNERQGMKAAAWAGLILALSSWPLALVFFGLMMGESFGSNADAAHHSPSQRFWLPIFTALVPLSFCASLWLAGFSVRHARVVSSITLAIDIVAIALVVDGLNPS